MSAWDPIRGDPTSYRLLADRLASNGVRYSAYAFDGWGDKTSWSFCDELIEGPSPTLAQVLSSGRYDLLHCNAAVYGRPYGVETWVRRARYRGPTVLAPHLARRELIGSAHATRYVAYSEEAAEILALDADGEVVVIPNAVDEEVFHPADVPSRERPLLVWVGASGDLQKDVWLFLEGLDALPDHDAVIADTVIDSRVADLVRERVLTLGPRVRVIGPQSPRNLAELLRAAAGSGGAFVSTSCYGGSATVLLGAMSCECPVVCPAAPGLGHLVDGRNAFVFDRRRGAAALVEAVERSRDPAVRSRVVRAGLDLVEGWSSTAMAEAYLRVYENALAVAPRGTLLQRLADPAARSAWRLALHARPVWQRRPRLLRPSVWKTRAGSEGGTPPAGSAKAEPARVAQDAGLSTHARVTSQARESGEPAIRYLLVVLTHGSSPNFGPTLESFRAHVVPQPVHGLLWIDGRDEGETAASVIEADHGDWTVSGGEPQQGFCGAVASAWEAAVVTASRLDCSHVFWLESDFLFRRRVDLRVFAELLDQEPGIAQVSLMRDPATLHERAAGGLYEARRDEYEVHDLIVEPKPAALRDGANPPSHPYLTHRSYWTMNSNLMRASFMAEHPWRVTPPQCEGLYTHVVLAAGLRFAVWGKGETWVTHLGAHTGFGY